MKSFKQFSELSSYTLRSYKRKADDQAYRASYHGNFGLANKRSAGSDKASDKIAKQMKAKYNEATYQGKKVPLNKPMAGDVKKSKVYVDPDGDGKAQKVNFGDKNMRIKKNIPARRKSFRARHNCDNPGPKDKARYWSCKAW